MEYFRKIADKDCEEAFNSLGGVYYYGYDNQDQNYEEAFKWYTKSAECQNDKGQFNLGLMYMKGESTEVNYDLALHWMKKAAYNGPDGAHKYTEKISNMIREDPQKVEQNSDLIKFEEPETLEDISNSRKDLINLQGEENLEQHSDNKKRPHTT